MQIKRCVASTLTVEGGRRIEGAAITAAPKRRGDQSARLGHKTQPAAPARPAGPPITNLFALRAASEARWAAVARDDPEAALRPMRDSFYRTHDPR